MCRRRRGWRRRVRGLSRRRRRLMRRRRCRLRRRRRRCRRALLLLRRLALRRRLVARRAFVLLLAFGRGLRLRQHHRYGLRGSGVGQRDEGRRSRHQGNRRGGEQSKTSLDHRKVYPGKTKTCERRMDSARAINTNRSVRIVAGSPRSGNFISAATPCQGQFRSARVQSVRHGRRLWRRRRHHIGLRRRKLIGLIGLCRIVDHRGNLRTRSAGW